MANTQPSGLQFTRGTMSDISGAATTAVTLLSAPGANKMHVVQAVWLNIRTGSTPWTGVGNAWLVYGTTGNDQVNLASEFITNQIGNALTASTNYIAYANGSIGGNFLGDSVGQVQKVLSSAAINAPVAFTVSNAVTAGNGTIDWGIWYYTVSAV